MSWIIRVERLRGGDYSWKTIGVTTEPLAFAADAGRYVL